MNYGDHIDAFEREASRFAEAVRSGGLEAPVPTCPEWTVADLVDHVGDFSSFWLHILCEGIGVPQPPYDGSPPGDSSSVAAWYEELAGKLTATLRSMSGSTEVWTWAPGHQNAGFVARRCAHELAVHRFDAESARWKASPIEISLAADAIEEIFLIIEVWHESGATGHGTFRGDGETLHLHGTASDRNHEWLVHLRPEGVHVERRHEKGDLALRGSVGDLELVLYGRPPVGEIERFGDETVLDAWERAFRF